MQNAAAHLLQQQAHRLHLRQQVKFTFCKKCSIYFIYFVSSILSNCCYKYEGSNWFFAKCFKIDFSSSNCRNTYVSLLLLCNFLQLQDSIYFVHFFKYFKNYSVASTTLMPNQCPTCVFNDVRLDTVWFGLDFVNPGTNGFCPATNTNKISLSSLLGTRCCCKFITTTTASAVTTTGEKDKSLFTLVNDLI